MIVNELKKENSGSLKSLDEVGTNEYQFDLEIDIETAIIHSELEKEQLEVLQKELNNLTKQQREVLYLSLIHIYKSYRMPHKNDGWDQCWRLS